MIRSLSLLAAGLTCVGALAGSASAQGVGEAARAPKVTAPSASARTTAPAARTKAREAVAARHMAHRMGDAGTAATGSKGSDAATASGSAAPGGPGSPPPTLPVPSPGTGATPPSSITGPGDDLFQSVNLLKT